MLCGMKRPAYTPQHKGGKVHITYMTSSRERLASAWSCGLCFARGNCRSEANPSSGPSRNHRLSPSSLCRVCYISVDL